MGGASAPVENGAIGLGTWATQAEFKDVKVTHGGKVLFASDFSTGSAGWRTQGELGGKGRCFLPDVAGYREPRRRRRPGRTDYSLTLKARKTAGAEGFLIMFRVKDDNNWFWLNVGGVGQHGERDRTLLPRLEGASA